MFSIKGLERFFQKIQVQFQHPKGSWQLSAGLVPGDLLQTHMQAEHQCIWKINNSLKKTLKANTNTVKKIKKQSCKYNVKVFSYNQMKVLIFKAVFSSQLFCQKKDNSSKGIHEYSWKMMRTWRIQGTQSCVKSSLAHHWNHRMKTNLQTKLKRSDRVNTLGTKQHRQLSFVKADENFRVRHHCAETWYLQTTSRLH